MLGCVVNISEGRRRDVIDAVATAAGEALLDTHTDPDHHRSVLTIAVAGPNGEEAVRAVATSAVDRIDLRRHEGAHPRLGALDVVPYVALDGSTLGEAVAARDRFARWAGRHLALPCFLYGPERSLPAVRTNAFSSSLSPDTGPSRPHPTAGAVAVGARPPLVAYNVWLAEPDLALARDIASAVRSDTVRALGLRVGAGVQVSMNLIAPEQTGPADAFDAVAARASVARAELVGLIPRRVLTAVATSRWAELDLDEARTIEARLVASGLAP